MSQAGPALTRDDTISLVFSFLTDAVTDENRILWLSGLLCQFKIGNMEKDPVL